LFDGKKIRESRIAQGLSMAQLAQKAGVPLQTIYFIEHKRMEPTLDVVIRISEALNVPYDEWYALEDNQKIVSMNAYRKKSRFCR
jgi:transcriptional regulator with XRE-family HTH domain